MSEPNRFNLPDPKDDLFNDKMVEVMRQVIEKSNKQTLDMQPVTTPKEQLQIGSIYFDSVDHKLKIITKDGTKVVKYE